MSNKWIHQHNLAKLNCLVPVYGSGDDAGNYTEVWLDDGQIILDRRRTKTVLKRLSSLLGVSWQQQTALWSPGKRCQLPPVVLGPDMVLVPLSLRHPQRRDEGGTGYAVENKIINYESHRNPPYRTRLYLKGDQVLPCLLNINTLKLRLLAAREALRRRQETYLELAAAGYNMYEPSYLLVEPDGSATPVQVVERRADLIVLRQESYHPLAAGK